MRIPFTGIDVGVKRSSGEPKQNWGPADDRWYMPWPWIGKNGNTEVTPSSATASSAVFSGVKIISETIASIPFPLYKKQGEGKRSYAEENSLFGVLKNLANPNLTAMEFREMMTAHMILRGNGFAQIIRGQDGQVVALYPLNPERMGLVFDDILQEYVYEYSLSSGKVVRLLREEVFHLRGPSDDGRWGKSFVTSLKELIGQNLTLDEYANNFYRNNAAPSGVLQMAAGMEMTPKAKDNLRDEWKKKYQGSNKSGSVAILEEGLEWKQIGMSSQDAQFIDTLKDARRQVLGCLRVPLYMAGDPEKLSFNTIEQFSIQFITYTMLPYFVRWEQTVYRDLLTVSERKKHFAEFLVNGLQRGDIVSRYRAYAVGRQWGWLSVNDVRGFENLDKIEGGDVYLQPLNMIDAQDAEDYLLKEDPGAEKPPGTKNETDDNSNPTLKNSLKLIERSAPEPQNNLEKLLEKVADLTEKVERIAEKPHKSEENYEKLMLGLEWLKPGNSEVIAEVLGRAMRKDSAAVATATRKNKLETIETDFYADHSVAIKESLTAIVNAQFNHISAMRIASGYDSRKVSESQRSAFLDTVVEKYNTSYRNAGDKVDSLSFELANDVVESLFKLALDGK